MDDLLRSIDLEMESFAGRLINLRGQFLAQNCDHDIPILCASYDAE